MVRNIIIGLVVLIALAVGGAYLLPQNAHVERSVVVKASPDEVYGVVNDMTRFNEWSPWAKIDPNAKYIIEGPPSGVGAKMTWTSDDANVGSGSQEIIESTPFSMVKTKLDFGAQGTAVATFSFQATEGGTKVTWGFDSDLGMNPISRYFGLMFDSMIGKDYESGLANLKSVVEAQSKAALQTSLSTPGDGTFPPDVPMTVEADPNKGPEVVSVEGRPVVLTRASAKASDDAAISTAFATANQKLLNFADGNGMNIAGAPLAITISHSAEGDWVFDAAMPLAEKPASTIAEADGVKIDTSYAGRAVKLTHKGPYSTVSATYARIHAYTKENKLKENGASWEEYVSDPGETADADLLTNVYMGIE